MADDETLTLEDFNAAPDGDLGPSLSACCASPRWVSSMITARPYADRSALLDESDSVFGRLEASDIDAALAGHPRIGERAQGEGTDAKWSRQEQGSVTVAGADIQEQIRAGNVAYEERFDRVFLIRAAGRAPEEIHAELTRRLDNDDDTEVAEVREQLRQITRLRLERLVQA